MYTFTAVLAIKTAQWHYIHQGVVPINSLSIANKSQATRAIMCRRNTSGITAAYHSKEQYTSLGIGTYHLAAIDKTSTF